MFRTFVLHVCISEVELTSYEEQHIDVAAGDDLSLETKPHEELKLGHQKIVGSETLLSDNRT